MQKKTPDIVFKVSQRFVKAAQFLYLSISNFNNNNLWESASSCSFGFLFSFVPIILIIVTILANILNVSPVVMNYVLSFGESVEEIFDIRPIINNIRNIKIISLVDFLLAVWVIWMARKLFLSIVQGMNRIFRAVTSRKGFFNQVLTFLSEFVIVVVFVILMLSSFLMNKILDLPFFQIIPQSFPWLFKKSSNILFSILLYFMLFIFSLYVYKVISGTHPKFRICVFYSAMNTGSFYVFSWFLNRFLNISNYNIIYGTISTLILLMMKAYFFFVIFMFFAQMVYVSQFFDNLLLSELYLLPESEAPGIAAFFRRTMFINPSVLQTADNTVKLLEGEILYEENSYDKNVYYLKQGRLVESRGENSVCFE